MAWLPLQTDKVLAVKETTKEGKTFPLHLLEAKVLKYLEPTGVVPKCHGLLHIPSDPANPSLVMDYVEEGKTMAMAIDALPPHWTDRTWICLCKDVFEALNKIHEMDILYNDIKPNNIMISGYSSPSPSVKIIDFGLATLGTGMYYGRVPDTGE